MAVTVAVAMHMDMVAAAVVLGCVVAAAVLGRWLRLRVHRGSRRWALGELLRWLRLWLRDGCRVEGKAETGGIFCSTFCSLSMVSAAHHRA